MNAPPERPDMPMGVTFLRAAIQLADRKLRETTPGSAERARLDDVLGELLRELTRLMRERDRAA